MGPDLNHVMETQLVWGQGKADTATALQQVRLLGGGMQCDLT